MVEAELIAQVIDLIIVYTIITIPLFFLLRMFHGEDVSIVNILKAQVLSFLASSFFFFLGPIIAVYLYHKIFNLGMFSAALILISSAVIGGTLLIFIGPALGVNIYTLAGIS